MIKEIANIIVKPIGTLEAVLWIAHVGFTMEGFAFVLSNISGNDGDINGGVHLVLVIATLVAVRLIAGRYSDRREGVSANVSSGFTPISIDTLLSAGFVDKYGNGTVLIKKIDKTWMFIAFQPNEVCLRINGVEMFGIDSMEELNSFWRMMTGEWLCKDKFK